MAIGTVVGGFTGNIVSQAISYGNVELMPALAQGLLSGFTAAASTGALSLSGLFPKTGSFKADFVSNLALWSKPGTPYLSRGASLIGISASIWFANYSLPSTNSLRENN